MKSRSFRGVAGASPAWPLGVRLFTLVALILVACDGSGPISPSSELLWRVEAPLIFQGGRDIAADGERVFAPIHEPFEDSMVLALDQSTGAELWRVDPVDDFFSLHVNVGTDGRFVYAGEDFDGLTALDPATGARIWNSRPEFITTTSVVFDADRVYVPGRGTVSGIDKQTGTALWTTFVAEIPAQMWLTFGEGALIATSERRRSSFGMGPEFVLRFSPTDGSVLWSFTDETLFSPETAAIADGVVVVASITGPVFGLDLATGKVVWEREFTQTAFDEGFVEHNGVVFTCSGISELDLLPGQLDDRPIPIESFCIALRARDGSELWRTPIADPYRSTPVVLDGALYTLDAGDLIRLDLRTGQIVDRIHRPAGEAFTVPPVMSGNRLFLTTETAVYAFLISP